MINRPLYLLPNHEEVAAKLGYNQAEIAMLADFAERGYTTVDLEIDEFDALAQSIIDGLDPRYPPDGRIQDGWIYQDGVRKLATNDHVLSVLKILYGRDAFPFQTLNFNKGTEQETHSDTIHFDSSPKGYMAGVWVALEDIDANNGPLHYYPGSHRMDQLTLADIGVRGSDMTPGAYQAHYEPMIKDFVRQHALEAEEGYIRKGQAIIWSANLLHGGSPIREEGRSRHSQVTHYYFDDCAYFTPLLSDPMLGRTYVRKPIDIRTGLARSGNYANGTIHGGLGFRIRRWIKARLGR